MRQLIRGLLRIKVRPYYLFHCDPVTGAGHFRTSVWKGIEIMEGLRGHISGLGIPTYVIDGVHGAGKIPVMPNYLLSASDDAVILRNYEGMIFRYAPDDHSSGAAPIESQGVSRVLSGNGKPLVPQDTPRINRRRKIALHKADAVMPPVSNPPATSTTAATPKAANGKSRSANGEAKVAAAKPETANGKAKIEPPVVASAHTAAHAATNGAGSGRSNGHANGHAGEHASGKANGSASAKASVSRANRANDSAKQPTMQELLRRPARSADNNSERKTVTKAEKTN
jgi:lysine 2,3-aminomutase